MIKHIAINAFLALGITFVIITAGIDLSIGATLGLCGMIAGWIITRYNVAPYICTLGTMYVLRGAAMLTSDGQTFTGLSGNPLLGNTGLDEIGAGTLLGIPWAIWIMIVLALAIAYVACRLAAMSMPLAITSAPPSCRG
ncbi:Ribose import permease protein RbsC [Sodalis praecaptivus]